MEMGWIIRPQFLLRRRNISWKWGNFSSSGGASSLQSCPAWGKQAGIWMFLPIALESTGVNLHQAVPSASLFGVRGVLDETELEMPWQLSPPELG